MTFSVTLPDSEPRTYGRLADAKKFASKRAVTLQVAVEVVATETNTVAFVATYVEGRNFHPFERIENARFVAPHFEGFVPSYTRRRIEATVYRSVDGEAVSYRVHDGRTGGTLDVATTRAACILTREMRLGRTL